MENNFLEKLFSHKEREVYVRLTALTWEEKPVEYIEGRATGGSINVDGASIVRRTCSLTLIAKDLNINDFYWGLKSKFKLEVGLKNYIDNIHPDIVWFRQGIYIITSFNTSYSTNNCTVSISGKDKMCLLNGDIAGALPHTTDFGVEEYYDSETNTTTYTNVPIRRIIQESLQNFGNELPQNIIINDLEDAGLELLEYRGDVPLFLLREVNSDTFTNMTINAKQQCYVDGIATTIDNNKKIEYDNLVNLTEGERPTQIQLTLDGKFFTVAKLEYGSIPGYRLTDLVYAGDLISNVGETLTSMLDKIKNMLGEFEYFYNLDGKFVFQKKQTYVDVAWNDIEKGDEIYANAAVNKSTPMWSFSGSQLITTIQNTPNLLNLRNDFVVWGKKKTTSGTQLDIHMRYAIDTKPTQYCGWDGTWYQTFGKDKVDWRELIYQMAIDYRRHYHDDDFLVQLAENNIPEGENISLYPTGRTGYEQYYVDMEGFWRQLYDLNPQTLKYSEVDNYQDLSPEEAYLKYGLVEVNKEKINDISLSDLFVIEDNTLRPFLQGYCHIDKNVEYWYRGVDGGIYSTAGLNDVEIRKTNLKEFYLNNSLSEESQLIKVALQGALDNNLLYIWSDGYYKFSNLSEEIQNIYYSDGAFKKEISYNAYDNFGVPYEDIITTKQNRYFTSYYGFKKDGWADEVSESPESLLFWFDFIEPETSELGRYSVKNVGIRSKALNDNDVKSIYYREIPKTIFQIGQETYEHQTGYTYIQLQGTMDNLFTISSKGKSAQERIEELLYQYSYCVQSTSLTVLPVYHLEPNTRIEIKDSTSGINGEYAVSKITIPLTYNGTMNITATKVVSNIN